VRPAPPDPGPPQDRRDPRQGGDDGGDGDRPVRMVRLAALMTGCLALLAAMLLLPEGSRARNLAWSIGVALLALSLVANRLVAKSQNRRSSEVDRRSERP
jgi:hypothetical protein